MYGAKAKGARYLSHWHWLAVVLHTRLIRDDRKVGLGHGNLGAMLLRDEPQCFVFLAEHESFAAAEGAS